MADLHALTRAERLALVDTLAGLTDAQWDAPSLCAGWRGRRRGPPRVDAGPRSVRRPVRDGPPPLLGEPDDRRHGGRLVDPRDGGDPRPAPRQRRDGRTAVRDAARRRARRRGGPRDRRTTPARPRPRRPARRARLGGGVRPRHPRPARRRDRRQRPASRVRRAAGRPRRRLVVGLRPRRDPLRRGGPAPGLPPPRHR
ncbi:maleylpyruvate isomerase N-terminal domain-containing protein [Nocardioides sp. J2M5]|nr:maleylpyruvate isomerase N-terminal domain-containing protein [Nocardioides palaemonis]